MHCRKSFPFGFATVLSLGTLAFAQGPAPAPLMVHQLKPNVYWIEGGGGNSGVIVGDKGVIVVDAKTTAAAGKELLDDIAKITPKPVTTVILTHSDGDHVNGLASFPAGNRMPRWQPAAAAPLPRAISPRRPFRRIRTISNSMA